MPFGVVSWVGRGMSVLDGGGDRRRRGGSFGVNLGLPIATNGDSDALLLWGGPWTCYISSSSAFLLCDLCSV